MQGLEPVGRPGWRWVALFTVLVVLPAIALTLLSIRAFQGEASRAAYQRRERQQQVLRLLENDLRDWCLSRDREPPGSPAVEVFEVGDSSLLLRRLNLFLSPGRERATEIRLSAKETASWQQARAAEATGRPDGASASAAYRRLAAGGPPLAPWARLALLRLSLRHRNCGDTAEFLAALRDNDRAAVTESGIPVWVASALLIKDAGSACPSAGAAPFLSATLSELQHGRWPLTAAQWIYYSQELQGGAAPGSASSTDLGATAAFLESLGNVASDLLALHREGNGAQRDRLVSRYVPALRAVVIFVPEGKADTGRILPVDGFEAEAARRLGVLTVAEDFEGRLALIDAPLPSSAALLPSFPFLRVSFADKSQPLWRAHLRRYLIFYMTAALLVIAAAGLALVYRTVAREIEVSRMKADFVSSVSHEFRTPLAALDALLERLESGKASDEEMRRRYYRASRQEVHRLTRMVNQLLSLARPGQNREPSARETFDLTDAAGEAVQSFVGLGVGARLQPALDTASEHLVCADRTATYQCVHNLLDNALKYSPADATVTVRTGRADGCAFVEVEDRGPGIPGAEQPHVFEQFYRGASARSSGVPGTGVGLAYVKKMTEAHGGRVTLESRPGLGSTFRLSFPPVSHGRHTEDAREPGP